MLASNFREIEQTIKQLKEQAAAALAMASELEEVLRRYRALDPIIDPPSPVVPSRAKKMTGRVLFLAGDGG